MLVVYANSGTARNEMEEQIAAKEDDDHSKHATFVDHENRTFNVYLEEEKGRGGNLHYDQHNCIFMLRYRKNCPAGDQVKRNAQ